MDNTFPAMSVLLPHAAPMILLDTVSERGPEHIECIVTVRASSPFVQEGHAPAVVTLEYMAQCAAAYVGFLDFDRGKPVEIGVVLGCRDMVLDCAHIVVGSTLRVRATRAWGDAVLGYFTCQVHHGADTIATASLSVGRGAALLQGKG